MPSLMSLRRSPRASGHPMLPGGGGDGGGGGGGAGSAGGGVGVLLGSVDCSLVRCSW